MWPRAFRAFCLGPLSLSSSRSLSARVRHCCFLQRLCVNAVSVAHSPQTLPAGSRLLRRRVELPTPSSLCQHLSLRADLPWFSQPRAGWLNSALLSGAPLAVHQGGMTSFSFSSGCLSCLPHLLLSLSRSATFQACLPSVFSLILRSSGECI